ncbi:hypothetical protein PTKIN_Ptkin09bG0168900 [Pterospermum kingtungense]
MGFLRKEPSPSESSSCIETSPGSDEVLKDQEKGAKPSLQLDLKLIIIRLCMMNIGLIKNSDLIDSLNTAGSSDNTTPETPQPTDGERSIFSCNSIAKENSKAHKLLEDTKMLTCEKGL